MTKGKDNKWKKALVVCGRTEFVKLRAVPANGKGGPIRELSVRLDLKDGENSGIRVEDLLGMAASKVDKVGGFRDVRLTLEVLDRRAGGERRG